MSRETKRVLTDGQWERVAPHLPAHPPSPRGGRPRADDRACLEGVLWLPRTGARWQDIPADPPSGSTCWRRLREWAAGGVPERIPAAPVAELRARGRVDVRALFADATFVRAKRGAWRSATPSAARAWSWRSSPARGLPLGVAMAAAGVGEPDLLVPALNDVPIPIPPGTPVVADKGHDSDPSRDDAEADGLAPVIPHRTNRVKPSRNDGRRLRRYRRRWTTQRTNAWLHC